MLSFKYRKVCVSDAAFGVLVTQVVELFMECFRVVVEVDKNVKAVQNANHVRLELATLHIVNIHTSKLLLCFRHNLKEADVTKKNA